MSFRTRLALVAAAAVALAVVAASGVVYVVVKDQLYSSVDDSLRESMKHIQRGPVFNFTEGPPQPGVFGGYPQAVRADGVTCCRAGGVTLPVSKRDIRVAQGETDTYFRNANARSADAGDTHVRLITFPYQPGYAVQIAQPLDDTDRALSRIRGLLFLIAAGGILIAGGLGLVVSRAALTPVRRLTQATETVTETGDLSERIEVDGKDELSRLASSVNPMLAALEESSRARCQLVADASHELRTPLTSLRTNIEVLASERQLPPGGEVEVGVRAGEVSVRDHGPGIAEEDLPYVVDRFYRAPSARGLPGSGLGLAIVRQVAQAHGGTVVAERAEGGGTVMRFRLNGAA
jgi:two-component system sensor histidine kinase MprB